MSVIAFDFASQRVPKLLKYERSLAFGVVVLVVASMNRRELEITLLLVAGLAFGLGCHSGRWTGPLVVVTGRTVLAVAAQALVACVYVLRHDPSPWQAAAPWWSVYGTLVDIGCLALMARFTRSEGIGLRDLIGRIELHWGHDVFVGIGWLPCGISLLHSW